LLGLLIKAAGRGDAIGPKKAEKFVGLIRNLGENAKTGQTWSRSRDYQWGGGVGGKESPCEKKTNERIRAKGRGRLMEKKEGEAMVC